MVFGCIMVIANVIKKSRRVSRLELRLNDDELEIIKGSARLLNKTVSDFIRLSVSCYIQNNLNVDRSSIRESHVVAKKKDSNHRTQEDSESIAFQLAKIGNNLNQITRAIHISNKIGKPVDLLRTYLLVEDYLKKSISFIRFLVLRHCIVLIRQFSADTSILNKNISLIYCDKCKSSEELNLNPFQTLIFLMTI